MHKLTRRELTNGAVMFGVSSSLGLLPSNSKADRLCDLCALAKLHPARFLASLVFDILLENAVSSVITYLVQNKNGGVGSAYNNPPVNEYTKGAYIVAGEADYDLYSDNRLKALTRKSAQDDRLGRMKENLLSQGVFIKSAYTSISYAVNDTTSVDDLMSVEYFLSDHIDVENEDFVRDLIGISGSSALDGFSND